MITQTAVKHPIRLWLERFTNTSVQLNLLIGVLTLATGLALLAVSFIIIYALLGLVTGLILDAEVLRVLLSLSGLGLLFYGNAVFSPTKPKSSAIPGVQVSIKQQAENQDTFQNFIRMLTVAAFCGPKVLLGGVDLIKKAKRLREMDLDGCVAVLRLLLSRQARVPYSEIRNHIPALDTARVFDQIEAIDGVLIMDSDPPGLSLSDQLRRELSLLKQ